MMTHSVLERSNTVPLDREQEHVRLTCFRKTLHKAGEHVFISKLELHEAHVPRANISVK